MEDVEPVTWLKALIPNLQVPDSSQPQHAKIRSGVWSQHVWGPASLDPDHCGCGGLSWTGPGCCHSGSMAGYVEKALLIRGLCLWWLHVLSSSFSFSSMEATSQSYLWSSSWLGSAECSSPGALRRKQTEHLVLLQTAMWHTEWFTSKAWLEVASLSMEQTERNWTNLSH